MKSKSLIWVTLYESNFSILVIWIPQYLALNFFLEAQWSSLSNFEISWLPFQNFGMSLTFHFADRTNQIRATKLQGVSIPKFWRGNHQIQELDKEACWDLQYKNSTPNFAESRWQECQQENWPTERGKTFMLSWVPGSYGSVGNP